MKKKDASESVALALSAMFHALTLIYKGERQDRWALHRFSIKAGRITKLGENSALRYLNVHGTVILLTGSLMSRKDWKLESFSAEITVNQDNGLWQRGSIQIYRTTGSNHHGYRYHLGTSKLEQIL